jgi:hypothetical protein
MDSLSPGPVRKPFTERRWRNLLTDIHDGQVGVIAGPELAVGSEAAVGATLYGYLARELTRRLGVDADRPGTRGSIVADRASRADRDFATIERPARTFAE